MSRIGTTLAVIALMGALGIAYSLAGVGKKEQVVLLTVGEQTMSQELQNIFGKYDA